MLIDTRTSQRQGIELRTELEDLPGAVLWVVNTHYHQDHCFGNAIFASAELFGHRRCATRLIEQGEAMRANLIDEIPSQADEWREVVITPPKLTFLERATIDIGSRDVELRYLGRGHTDTDIVVTVPSVGVLFAGDLLENGAPPWFRDSYPLDWPTTLEALVALSEGPIVPGHGDVADRAFAERSRAEIEITADLGRQVAAGDLALDTAVMRGPYGPRPMREALERAVVQVRGRLEPDMSWDPHA